jgi:hypothetical protein
MDRFTWVLIGLGIFGYVSFVIVEVFSLNISWKEALSIGLLR